MLTFGMLFGTLVYYLITAFSQLFVPVSYLDFTFPSEIGNQNLTLSEVLDSN
jgi:hypothetical protein